MYSSPVLGITPILDHSEPHDLHALPVFSAKTKNVKVEVADGCVTCLTFTQEIEVRFPPETCKIIDIFKSESTPIFPKP